MENQYIERGIYKVRQDGTKDFVAFKTREEKLAEEKKRARNLRIDAKRDGWYEDIDRICIEMRQAGYDNPSILFFNDKHRLGGTTICPNPDCSDSPHCEDIPDEKTLLPGMLFDENEHTFRSDVIAARRTAKTVAS